MGIFSSLAGPLIGGVLSGIGGRQSAKRQESGARAAQQAAAPFSVFGPTGFSQLGRDQFGNPALNLGFDDQTAGLFGQLGDAASGALNIPGSAAGQLPDTPSFGALPEFGNVQGFGGVQDFGALPNLPTSRALNVGDANNLAGRELQRIRGLQAPLEAQTRASLLSRLKNSGRLGLGVGSTSSGRNVNPELAAFEEAVLRNQLGQIGSAQDFASREQSRRFGEEATNFQLGLAGNQARSGFDLAREQARFGSDLAGEQARFGAGLGAAELGTRQGLGVFDAALRRAGLGSGLDRAPFEDALRALQVRQGFSPLGVGALGVSAAAPGGVAGLAALPDATRGRQAETFFSSLGGAFGDEGGIFSQGGIFGPSPVQGDPEFSPAAAFGFNAGAGNPGR